MCVSKSMCVCIYMCVYVYIRASIHNEAHTCIHTYTHVHIYIHTSELVCITKLTRYSHTSITYFLYIHEYTCMYTYRYRTCRGCARLMKLTRYSRSSMAYFLYIRTLHTKRKHRYMYIWFTHICMYICIHTRVYLQRLCAPDEAH